MKRIIPVLLVLAVTISCFISPAAASTFGDDNLVNALLYQESNSFFYNPNTTTFSCKYSKPNGTIRYAEVLFSTNVSSINVRFFASSYANGLDANVIPLGFYNGQYLYRATWTGYTSRPDINVHFNSTSNIGNLIIQELKYSISSITADQLYGQCIIQAVGMADTIIYRPEDASNYRNWTPVSSAYNSYQLALTAYDIELYDYINFLVYVSAGSVTSVNVYDNGNNLAPIPFTVNYLNNSSEPGTWYISVTVDLRSLNKSTCNPCVVVEGDLFVNQANHVSVDSITGWYYLEEVDPILFWLKTIKTDLGVWFRELITSVNSLSNGSTQDQTNANNFNSAVTDQQQELEDMAGVMDSVTRPALDDVDVNFDRYVSQDDISGLTSPLQALFTGDIFGVVLIMSIMMGTVSFVFYGKR